MLGKISEEDFWVGLLESAGAKNIDIDKAKIIYRETQKEIDEMLSLIKKLKSNYNLSALANISKEWLDVKIKKFNLKDLFDVIVSSGYCGVAKPNLEIYKILLGKLKVPANECVFIDDKEKQLCTASELGINTILFTGQKELEKKLNEMGVKF